MAEELPLILSDGTNSYIYGPSGYPVEQINSKNEPFYLHHDQQGSTRLITGSTGTVGGKCTYGAYGTPTCEGTATTPIGYDGQYTNGDTGLIYLRARYYDPATAQFLTVDPALTKTHEPYVYVGDRPLAISDPSGECAVARTAALNSTAEECKKLLGSIGVTVRSLIKRLKDMEVNRRRLTPAEVKNYIKTFEDKQIALRKKLKKWNRKNCSEEIGETLPAEVWALTEVKVRKIIVVGPGI
jgi:RHS repeat-associated protein